MQVKPKDHFLERAQKGHDYLDIKRELHKCYFLEAEKKAIMNEVNAILLQKEQESIKKSKATEFIYAGIALTFIGIIITAGTYMMQGSQFYVAYGAIGVGVALLIRGINAKRGLEGLDSPTQPKKRKTKFDRF